jgi:LysM repeat protein
VRYLAPALLLATVIGAILIITSHTGSSGPSSPAAHVVNHRPRGRGKYANATFYTVQPGDNLTAIASKTGIPILTIEQLNQSLDPNSLQTGQRLRLRR